MIRSTLPSNDPVLQASASFGVSRIDAYGAIAAGAIEEGVTGFAFRALERSFLDTDKEADFLSADEANADYGIEGHLTFDSSVSDFRARELNGIKQRELARSDIISRSGLGSGEILGVALAASLLDPVGDALALVPYLGTGAKAASIGRTVAKSTTISGRLGRGAVEGVASGVIVEAAVFPLAKFENRDYGASDAVFNIALSGGIGSVGRLIGDGLKARGSRRDQTFTETEAGQIVMLPENALDIAELPAETRVDIFNQALNDLDSGQPIRAGEMIERAQQERAAALLDPETPETTPRDSGGDVDDVADTDGVGPDDIPAEFQIEGALMAARTDTLLRFYDGDIEISDAPSLDPAIDASPFTPFNLDGLVRGDEALDLGEAAAPAAAREPGLADPVLQQDVARLEAEVKGMIENGRLNADVLELETPERAPEQVKDLYEAAGFCLRAEGLL